ncbi:MAG: oxidoreductase [Acidobacteria bacterium]|nr:oxidoreductase [Acidobacteriota bacterium]
MMLRFAWIALFAPMLEAQYKLVTVDPGHFHAALIQKEALADLSAETFVYAPFGADLTAHLNRVILFNTRPANPTNWKATVHASPDYFERMLHDKPGQIVVLSGRNKGKIERMRTIASAGMHILADKPWVIEPEDLPKLGAALDAAKAKDVILYDGMTQRYEITCLLQKALVNDAAVFGEMLKGSAVEPAVYLDSVHYLLKMVAGAPNRRPPWFFDIRQQGEGLTDVGTHLVDLVQWTLSPEKAIDTPREVQVLEGKRWPTVLTPADFQKVTGESAFPDYVKDHVRSDGLHYFCNNSVHYTLRGVHVKMDVKWGFEAAPGQGDSEVSIYRGTKSRVEVRDNEVLVIPAGDKAAIGEALRKHIAASPYAGLSLEERGDGFRVAIPQALRIGHEAHFALLAKQFLDYVKKPNSLPAWEQSFLTAKYFVTTQGVALARKQK